MHTEMHLLQAENRRLFTIIDALTEKILNLEAQLSRSEGTIHQETNPSNEPVGTNQEYMNPTNKGIGTNQEYINPTNKDIGTKQEYMNPTNNDIGTKQEYMNTTPAREGTIHECINPAHGAGRTEPESINTVRAPERVMQTASKPLPGYTGTSATVTDPPADLPPNMRKELIRLNLEAHLFSRMALLRRNIPSIKAIAQALKSGPLPELRSPQSYSLPLLLQWLCKTDVQTTPYAVLQKLLGFSYTGVYKLLTAAIRAGLVQRIAWQRYALTDLGVSVLEAAAQQKL